MAAFAAPVAKIDESHVAVSLISEQAALVPGKTAWFGIRLQHAPQWHTYWVNPGDSGLATKLSWSVPYGFRPGEIAWPAPQRFDVGGLFNFGYGGDVLLPVPVGVSTDAVAGTKAHIAVTAKWLVCHEECVPGKATLTLDLPIAASAMADARWIKSFAAARASQPQAAAWSGQARLVGDHVEVLLHGTGLPPVMKLDAFSPQMRMLANTAPQASMIEDDTLQLTFAKSDYFAAPPATLDLILTSASPPRAWNVSLPFVAAP